MKGIVYWTPYICMHSASVYEELGKRLHVIIACKSLEYGTFGGLNMKNVEIVYVEEEDDVDILIQRIPFSVHHWYCSIFTAITKHPFVSKRRSA